MANDSGLPKTFGVRLSVWMALRRRSDYVLVCLALLVLVGLSELVLDTTRTAMPSEAFARAMRASLAAHVMRAGTAVAAPPVVAQWLDSCVRELPRLPRPPAQLERRRTSNVYRYLACAAFSTMVDEGSLLTDMCTGAGGSGYALYLAARAAADRNLAVVIEHYETTYLTGRNFANSSYVLLKQFAHMCDRGMTSLACLDVASAWLSGGQRSRSIEAALSCRPLRFAVLQGVYVGDLPTKPGWDVVASGVDYVVASPVLHPLCWLRLPGCERVPWVMVYHTLT